MFKTGDIVFFSTPFKWYKPLTWLSAAIRIVAGIEYNHVGIIVLIWGRPFIIEAVGKGIVAVPLHKRIKDQKVKIVRPFRKINEKDYAVKAIKHLSKKYDVVGLLIHQLVLNITGKWIGAGENKEDRRLYCYEYAALMNKEDYPDWYKVDVFDFLHASWHFTIYEH